MKDKIDPRIEKNLCDLSHDRQLQKSHAWINLGLGFWLAFIAIMATWIIEGEGKLNTDSVFIILLGTSLIGAFFFSFYWVSKRARIGIINKIGNIKLDSS